ncbi:MAG: polysaccharide deacetylase family protein [Nitrososphaerales archaeon]
MFQKPYDYSAIVERKKLRLPDSARIAVWLILNIENWYLEAPARSILATPAGAQVEINVPNYSWHEYGMRVGFWRLKPVLQRVGFRPTVALNGSVCTAYPKVAEGCKEEGWEIMGHGFTQRILPTEPDEEEVIAKTRDTIESFFGKRPRGWLSPGLAETRETLRILSRNGFDYVCDWVNDDQPYEITVDGRIICSMPYTLELNDIVLFANQHFTSEEFYTRVREQFDTLYSEGIENPRVMAVAIHPYLSGVPHRIRILEKTLEYISSQKGVYIATGSEILDTFKSSR